MALSGSTTTREAIFSLTPGLWPWTNKLTNTTTILLKLINIRIITTTTTTPSTPSTITTNRLGYNAISRPCRPLPPPVIPMTRPSLLTTH